MLFFECCIIVLTVHAEFFSVNCVCTEIPLLVQFMFETLSKWFDFLSISIVLLELSVSILLVFPLYARRIIGYILNVVCNSGARTSYQSQNTVES